MDEICSSKDEGFNLKSRLIKVLFDTNVWSRIVLSEQSDSMSEYNDFLIIKKAITENAIVPYISTTWFIEQIPKEVKCSFLLSSIAPQRCELDKISTKFNYCYLYFEERLFFIDKLRNEVINFDGLCKHSINVLRARIVPALALLGWESGVLNTSQLNYIIQYTSHRLPTRVNVLSRSVAYPELTQQAKDKLNRAINLGFKLINTPRIGYYFHGNFSDDCTSFDESEWLSIQNRTGYAQKFIKNDLIYKAGEQLIYQIANDILQRNNLRPCSWASALKYANNEELRKISSFISELCDGDIVISCYANQIDYLCTNDCGRTSGIKSVFSEENKKLLSSGLGVKVLRSKELSSIFS